MSGSDLLKMLSAMDENARDTTERVGSEVVSYIRDHTDEVIQQLRASRVALVPTSIGNVEVKPSDLRQALEARSMAA